MPASRQQLYPLCHHVSSCFSRFVLLCGIPLVSIRISARQNHCPARDCIYSVDCVELTLTTLNLPTHERKASPHLFVSSLTSFHNLFVIFTIVILRYPGVLGPKPLKLRNSVDDQVSYMKWHSWESLCHYFSGNRVMIFPMLTLTLVSVLQLKACVTWGMSFMLYTLLRYM